MMVQNLLYASPLIALLATTGNLASAFNPSIPNTNKQRATLWPRRTSVAEDVASSAKMVKNEKSPERSKAIVVGGGPVGLAAALVLARAPHSYDVTLFESTIGKTSTSNYDPTKAFLYNVNPRGQVLTKQFPSMQRKLEERGIESGGAAQTGFVVVPADPDEPLPEVKSISVAGPPQARKTRKEEEEEEEAKESSYWIPRHTFVQLMKEVVDEHEKERAKKGDDSDETAGKIDFIEGKECIKVRPIKSDSDGDKTSEMMQVTVRDTVTQKESSYLAQLVVGADGWKSKVRQCLATDEEAFASWPNVKHKKFQLKKWMSPASGLKLKALQFPPRFKIPDSDGTSRTSTGATMYAFRSVNTGPRNYVSFGLLPMKDDAQVRPANVITRPNHEVWTLHTGKEARDWFERAFPRLHFDDMISEEEWERFAKAQGTSFPPCQYSPGLQVSSPGGDCGVVLVGDSAHAYPPDIGQGVNSGLGDVVALDRALRGLDVVSGKVKKGKKDDEGERPTLGSALKEYERLRGPEIKALIRLARFGAPYQYRQPLYRDRIGRQLWTFNVVLRVLLNKLSFGIIPKSSIMLAQGKKLTFRQVMRRADITTAGLTAVLLIALFGLLRRFTPLPL